jgi:hypothetical protein
LRGFGGGGCASSFLDEGFGKEGWYCTGGGCLRGGGRGEYGIY